MADYPPLSRFYVASYAANDRDYPVVAIRLDPRTAGYKVPEDLSPHPDSKRYPNHVFTGAQPSAGDQIVTHVYEILPAPWVPFTRYDDDLGPIQGRRRSVKNEGQVARLGPDQRVNYEAREGSAIVYTEIEEAWSITTDDDGNSLFPVRDRDFYDTSRGAVQERRQLFVPTGEEVGTLENINGVITQTSYEPYNEYLSVKIVQTYKVDGPQLIGKATDEARQLATVTTQRKGSADYVPPSPTAMRTVEVSREDAESLVERIVEVPEVFGAETYRKTREDITPQKFKAAQEDVVFEKTIEGIANPTIILGAGEFVKSEEQVNKFTKRVSTTSRSITSAIILLEKVLTPQGQIGTRTLRLDVGDQSFTPSATLIDASVEALGDGRTVKTEVRVDRLFNNKTSSVSKPEVLPERFRASIPTKTEQEIVEQTSVEELTLEDNEIEKTEERITEFAVRKSTTTRDEENVPELDGLDYEESFNVQIPYTEKISTELPTTTSSEAVAIDSERYLIREYDPNEIQSYLQDFEQSFPTTISFSLPKVLESIKVDWDEKQQSGTYENVPTAQGILYQFSNSDKGEVSAFHSATPIVSLTFKDVWSQNIPATVNIFFLKNPVTKEAILSKVNALEWPVFKPKSHVITGKGVEVRATAMAAVSVSVQQHKPAEFGAYTDQSKQTDYTRSITPVTINVPPCLSKGIIMLMDKTLTASANTFAATAGYGSVNGLGYASNSTISDVASIKINIPATSPTDIPSSGTYLVDSSVEFFKYGFSVVRATTIDASIFA
jgi:hypothetical protein